MMRAVVLTVALTLLAAPGRAADIKVISAGAVRTIIAAMIEDYSRQTGHTFDFKTGPTGLLRAAIASGAPADLIIASDELMAELERTGKMTPGTRLDLGRMGLGVVIRVGAPAPDLSTPQQLKQVLIDAKSIAYTDPKLGGTSVIHLMRLAERFGIKDLVVAKGVPATGGNDASRKVAAGEAEIGVALISEILPIKGAKLAAPLPGDTQLWTIYTSAIPASSTNPAVARAFVAALAAPAMAERWKASGFEPVK